MRVFLNGILSFIGSESLTDVEFGTIPAIDATYSVGTYEALKAVLQDRENVSGQLLKLKNYYEAKGVSLTGVAASTGVSNIFFGCALD